MIPLLCFSKILRIYPREKWDCCLGLAIWGQRCILAQVQQFSCPSTCFPSQDAFYAGDAFTQVRGSNLCPWPSPHAVSRGSERTSWAELLHLSEKRDPGKESPKVSLDKLMWPGGFRLRGCQGQQKCFDRGSGLGSCPHLPDSHIGPFGPDASSDLDLP